MNHKERKQQLEIDICKLIEAYNQETGFTVSDVRLEYVNAKLCGEVEKRTLLMGVIVTAEV